MGLNTLLTYDRQFVRSVRGNTPVLVTQPSDFWASLGIAAGADPVWTPADSNPLSVVTWWRV